LLPSSVRQTSLALCGTASMGCGSNVAILSWPQYKTSPPLLRRCVHRQTDGNGRGRGGDAPEHRPLRFSRVRYAPLAPLRGRCSGACRYRRMRSDPSRSIRPTSARSCRKTSSRGTTITPSSSGPQIPRLAGHPPEWAKLPERCRGFPIQRVHSSLCSHTHDQVLHLQWLPFLLP